MEKKIDVEKMVRLFTDAAGATYSKNDRTSQNMSKAYELFKEMSEIIRGKTNDFNLKTSGWPGRSMNKAPEYLWSSYTYERYDTPYSISVFLSKNTLEDGEDAEILVKVETKQSSKRFDKTYRLLDAEPIPAGFYYAYTNTNNDSEQIEGIEKAKAKAKSVDKSAVYVGIFKRISGPYDNTQEERIIAEIVEAINVLKPYYEMLIDYDSAENHRSILISANEDYDHERAFAELNNAEIDWGEDGKKVEVGDYVYIVFNKKGNSKTNKGKPEDIRLYGRCVVVKAHKSAKTINDKKYYYDHKEKISKKYMQLRLTDVCVNGDELIRRMGASWRLPQNSYVLVNPGQEKLRETVESLDYVPFGVSNSAKESKNIILYGPPGTGKTYRTVLKALQIINPQKYSEEKVNQCIENKNGEYREALEEYRKMVKDEQIKFTTFHQSYSYEEFIEGIKPKVDWPKVDGEEKKIEGSDNEDVKSGRKDIEYIGHDGIFKKFCDDARGKGVPYVFIIDEINRGNVSKIFGELITLIEDTKRDGAEEHREVTLPYSGDKFSVPNNVYIIGTMNTADRSIALLDTALRRRFDFEELMPNVDLLDGIKVEVEDVKIEIDEMLKTINKRITVLIDREHQIGHAYFTKLLKEDNRKTIDVLKDIFRNKVFPLLQEYFYDDYEKIRLVLGKGEFITKEKIDKTLFNTDNKDDSNSYLLDEESYTYKIVETAFCEAENYKLIYSQPNKKNISGNPGENTQGDNDTNPENEPTGL